jgi:YD repeat-containing protein
LSLGGGIGGILYCKQSGSFYYYHYDGSGNVTSVTDGDGEEVAIYEYDSFGNVAPCGCGAESGRASPFRWGSG